MNGVFIKGASRPESCFVCPCMLRNQSEAEELIENFLSFVENELPRLLKDGDDND